MEMVYFLRVAAAFLADREREVLKRLAAALRACRDSACFVAALCPSRLRAFNVARERVVEGLLLEELFPLRVSRWACSRVFFDAVASVGDASFTPARRALDSPIAIACFVERAPCLPSRTCSISSRTNSPACVLGAFPSLLSFLARSSVSFSGIVAPFAAS